MKITYIVKLPPKIIVTTDITISSKGISDHNKLKNLDYESSGHTGFASSEELKQYAKQEDLATSISIEEIDKLINGG